jgi:hypothetical protein
MKVVIISVPMMPKKTLGGKDILQKVIYPVDGNKSIEYDKPICCPVNGVLARTLKKGEEVKVIYLITGGEKRSYCEDNKQLFIEELEGINAEIGAILNYDTVEMEFDATRKTHNKLILDIADKIPENAEIIADITYGFKTETFSLICALRFVEEFRDTLVQHIIYGKLEKNPKTNKYEDPMIYDVASLYYLFNLIGSMGDANLETATKTLKDFFAI